MQLRPRRFDLVLVLPLVLVSVELSAGLRHHWRLDETSGLTAAELASGNDGALVNFEENDDTQWVPAQFEGGLNLGAGATINNYVRADVPAMSASATGGFTILMWVNPGDAIFGSPGEYQLFSSPGDAVGFTMYNNVIEGETFDRVLLIWDSSAAEIIVSAQSLEPGNWYHVAMTSTGPGGEKKIYIDGVEEPIRLLIPSMGGSGVGFADGWAAGTIELGAIGAAGRTHNSTIDDVRIYDEALSEAAIQAVMNTPPPAAPAIRVIAPVEGDSFHDFTDGIRFEVEAPAGGSVSAADIRMSLNGADVTGSLVVTGSSSLRTATYNGLEAEKTYTCVIEVAPGGVLAARKRFSFATLTQATEPGLRHHWRFDEGNGLSAADTAGGAIAALTNFENNDDAQWVPGIEGGACDFGIDASFNNFATASTVALSAIDTGGFTIAMWIYPGERILTTGEYQLLSSPGDAVGFTIFNATIQGNLRERRLLFWDGSLPECIVSEQSIDPGLWYHVAITSTGPGGEKKIYINGEEEPLVLVVPQLGGTGIGNSNGWGDGTIEIGGIGGPNRTHDTVYDDVRVYEYALTPEDIQDLVPSQPPRPPAIANLVPANGDFFHAVASGLSFDVNAVGDGVTIAATDIHLMLNGADVTGSLAITGGPTSRHVVHSALQADTFYDGLIDATDSGGLRTQMPIAFGTFQRSVAPGLRHHWKLDERSGLTALDSSSGANAELLGFELNDDAQWVQGQVGGGLNLGVDATVNNYLRPTLPAMSAASTGGFTYALWIRPGDSITKKGEYQLLNAPGSSIGFSIQNNTSEGVLRERVLYLNDGSLPRARVGTTKLEPGTWYHVAFTSTGAGGVRRIYLNGAPEKTEPWQPSQGGEDTGTADGWNAGAATLLGFLTGRRHNSTVDDIRVYEEELSAERIAQLATAGPPVKLFHRGDVDQNTLLQLTDAVQILGYLFLGSVTRAPDCLDAADADDNGLVQLTDAVRILAFLFLGGPPPASPGPPSDPCGSDASADELDCVVYSPCA